MRRWLDGKWAAILGLLVITALVAGGLGWVTAAALRLEEEQRQALEAKTLSQAETDQAHKVRLALWRLDTHVYADLAREANRPYHDYTAFVAAAPPETKSNDATKGLTVLELLLSRPDDAPGWMSHSYLVALEADWKAPQALRDDLVRYLNVSRQGTPARKAAADEDPVLATINRSQTIPDSLNQLRRQDAAPAAVPPAQAGDNPLLQRFNYQDNARGREGNQGKMVQQQPSNSKQVNVDPDTQARQLRGASDRGGTPLQNVFQEQNAQPRDAKQPVVILGPTSPLWLTEGPDERLVLARLVQIGQKPACQVTVLDWPALEAELLGLVQDLLPEAKLLPDPAPDPDAPGQERALTALPVKLDPGPLRVPAVGGDGSTLRYGFALAWAAALLAILVVALGGWALLDLSERRIRFVSAVTHELRTPLTSLRLYLDMLTSGIVTDEKRKDEYLQTLNSETDRLNRLVGNVLDFSRLENQRPKLSLSYVTVSDLLYQLRTTWEGRCQDAGKQLVLENAAGEEHLLHTDEQMAQQILGNLIDNACKYSRGAEDPRILLRARAEGDRLVLEVEDGGPGVPTAERRSIFRAFRRGRGADVTTGGVGLGLALAQRWARLLGGSVSLASPTQGKGACFHVVLPGLSI